MKALRGRETPIIAFSLFLFVLSLFILTFRPFITSSIPVVFFVPFVVTAIWIRSLTSAERKDFNWQVSKWISVLIIFVGTLFWLTSATVYVMSVQLFAPYPTGCCLGQVLQWGIPLIPWVMISIGSLTLFLTFSRRPLSPAFEVASFGLFASMMLTNFLPLLGGLGGGLGWPLAWWSSSLTEFGSLGHAHATAFLLPFLLDWVFLSISAGLLLCLGGMLFIPPTVRELETPSKSHDSRSQLNPKAP